MLPQYVIYGSNDCKHCVEAKRFLTGLSIPFEWRDVTKSPDDLAFLKEQGFKAIPQIWRTDGDAPEYIGGCSDLKTYLKVGL